MNASRRDFLKQTTRLTLGGIILGGIPTLSTKTKHAPVHRAFYTMGTIVTIHAYGEESKATHRAISKAQEEFQRIDAWMSVYKPESQVSRINRFAGEKEVEVNQSVLEVLRSARKFYEDTQGAFNVCVEPLMRLWGFRNDPKTLLQLPSDREINRAKEAAAIRHLVINEKENKAGLLHRDASIDLGGIAVGYSVDRAGAILKSEGIDNFLIDHSGDILAAGTPPDQDGWVVSVPDPKKRSEMAASFSIKNRAVSTSGNYESFVLCRDKSIGHIMDPDTGYPSERLLSFTAICPTAMEADAYSTGCFSRGIIPGDMEHVAVTCDSKVVISDTIYRVQPKKIKTGA